MKSVVIYESDCKTEADGYHINVWESIKESLGLSPTCKGVEVKVVDFDEVSDE
jgi:hypothetical protein